MKFILIILFIFTISDLLSFITKEQAISIVLDSILVEELDYINIYVKDSMLSSQDSIQLINNAFIKPTSYPSWLFFSDDYPTANWAHSCRYIFINYFNGENEIVNEIMYPDNQYSDFRIISSINYPDTTGDVTPLCNSPRRTRPDNPNLYAIIIGGDKIGEMLAGWFDDECFWNNESKVFTLLTNYGYAKDNIRVHYSLGSGPYNDDLDGPPQSDDIYGQANKESIESSFQDFENLLTPQDQLFVFLDNHGMKTDNPYESFLYLPIPDTLIQSFDPENFKLYDYELVEYTRNIDCSHIVYLINCCYSGGFIDNIVDDSLSLCKNKIVHTPCGYDQEEQNEHWMTTSDSLIYPKFGEFLLYWSAAADSCYPSIDQFSGLVIPYAFGDTLGNINFTLYGTFNSDEYENHTDYPDYSPDVYDGNNDGYMQLHEIFRYANNYNTYSDDRNIYYFNGVENQVGYFCPYCDEVIPLRNQETPQSYYSNNFIMKFLTLEGIAGSVSENDSINEISGTYSIGGKLTLQTGDDFTIAEGSTINLIGAGKIIVASGTNLILENNVTITGKTTDNYIEVYGTIEIGDEETFTDLDDDEWGGLRIYSSDTLSIDNLIFENCELYVDGGGSITLNNATFTGAHLYSEDTEITIIGGSLNDSDIDHSLDDLTMHNVTCLNTQINASMFGLTSLSEIVSIDSCSFTQNITQSILCLNSFPNFEINNSTFNSNARTCIYLYESGYGKTHLLADNEIDGNAGGSGLYLYDSSIDILGINEIHDNEYGIFGSNSSNIYIFGSTNSPYQRINNNEEGIKVSHNSFPTKLRYTEMQNNTDYHLDCYNHSTGTHDIENNYWGNPNSPSGYLYPNDAAYDYDPVWTRDIDEVELLYDAALSLIAEDNFVDAQQIFFDIVSSYPNTEFAKGSLKKLLRIESSIDNNYYGLQNYYLTDLIIQSNSELSGLADKLANFCNLYANEFENAIIYFEEIIINPPTQLDSIFAVIDAGYTYLLMESQGYRSDYVGSIPSLKPASWAEFEKKRDLLLGLYPEESSPEENQESPVPIIPILESNYPNPFNPETTLSFSIPADGRVTLSIYNVKGQKVKTLVDTEIEKGFYNYIWDSNDFNGNDVKSGVYLYELKVNGRTESVKKMLLLK